MKKIILTALLVVGLLPLSAQNSASDNNAEYTTSKQQSVGESFWTNCFASVGIGGQMYIGDHNHQLGFGDRLSFAFDLAVGKRFESGVGVRLMYSGLPVKGATQNGAHSNGQAISGKPWNGYWLTEQRYYLSNLHADVMYDVLSLLKNKEQKKWSLSPYVGLGWAHVGEAPKANCLSFNGGLITSYSLNDMFDLNLDLRATLLSDGMDGEKGGNKGEGVLSATIGISYKFK